MSSRFRVNTAWPVVPDPAKKSKTIPLFLPAISINFFIFELLLFNLYNFYPNKINATECTGAGDVFASTFVATYSKTNDIIKSIKVAMANSESVVVSKGANMGVLSWNEIENKLKKKTFRVVKVKE